MFVLNKNINFPFTDKLYCSDQLFVLLLIILFLLFPGVPTQLALRGRAEHVGGCQGRRHDPFGDRLQEWTL